MYFTLGPLFCSLAQSATDYLTSCLRVHVLDINPVPEITADPAGASALPLRKENSVQKGTVAPQSQKAQK